MKIECSKCHTIYRLDERRFPEKQKVLVRCKHCNLVMSVDISTGLTIEQSKRRRLLPENLLYGEDLKQEVNSRFKKLYPMPHIMLKARQILADPKSDFKELSNLVKTDQALASRILKAANSAYFGRSGQVSSIQQAAVLLGSKLLVRIITVLAQSKMLGRELKGYGMNSGDLWKHSLAVSAGSDIIAKEISPEYRGEAFLAGLLHDAGKILLDPYILERKEAYNELTQKSHQSQIQIEQYILRLDHAIVSSELCVNWNLPDFVGEAIRFHHSPSSSKANMLAYILHAADTIAHKTGSSLDEIALSVAPDSALKFLRLDENALKRLVQKIFDSVETLEEDTY